MTGLDSTLGKVPINPNATRICAAEIGHHRQSHRTPQSCIQIEPGAAHDSVPPFRFAEEPVRLFKETALPVPTRELEPGPQEVRVGRHRTEKEIASRTLLGGHHPLE